MLKINKLQRFLLGHLGTSNWTPYFVKETLSRFRETEIDQSSFSNTDKEEMKSQWKQWLDATTHGIKDELRAEGKLV